MPKETLFLIYYVENNNKKNNGRVIWVYFR